MWLKFIITILIFSLIHGRTISNERDDWVTNEIPATNLPDWTGWTTAATNPTTIPSSDWTEPDLPVTPETTWGTWTLPSSTIEN